MKQRRTSATVNGKMFSPYAIILVVAASIYLCEMLLTIVLSFIFPPGSIYKKVFDAILLTVLMIPVLFYFVYRPYVRQLDKYRESEQKFRAIAETAADAIISANSSGEVIFWNPGAEKMFGYAESEMLGKSVEPVIPRRYLESHRRGLARVAGGGDYFLIGRTAPLEGVRKDGSEFPLELSLSSWEAGGERFFTGIIRDVTEQKRKEDDLSVMESKLKEAMRIAKMGYWSWETATGRRTWSKDIYLIYGLDPSLPAPSFSDSRNLYTPESWDRFAAAILEGVSRGAALECDLEVVRPDGTHRWVTVRGETTLDAEGQVIGLHGSKQDITERKLMEEEFRAIDSRLKEAMGLAKLGHWSWDTVTDKHAWSDEIYLIYGRDPSLPPADYQEVPRYFTPDSWARLSALVEEALALGKAYECDAEVVRPDGTRRWMTVRGRATLGAGGKVVRLHGTVQDITERKLMEEELLKIESRLKESMELAKLGYWSWDTINDKHVWSEEIYLIYGRDPALPPADFQEVPKYFTPESWKNLSASVEEGLSHGRAYECDAEVVRPDGTRRWVTARGQAVLGAEGKVVRLHGTVQDITERKRMESELQALNAALEDKVAARTADLERARREADDANRAKSTFLAVMSHEIRTPMNGVIGMADVLRQTSLKPQQVEMVTIIQDSALSLLNIIDDILDFSKIEAGRLQVESVPTAVADVVERACGIIDRMALKKGTELTMFVDPAVPREVSGDPGRLRQILINLLNNAVKFSSGDKAPGKVSIRASLAESKPGGVVLEFRVADNGIGMDEKTRERLFTAFMQADQSTTRTYGGTGLGLAISRQLTQLMGGEITAHSQTGKGSVFIVRIPFVLPTETPETKKIPSLVEGLSCLVVGGIGSLSADVASYLSHAGAATVLAPDLTDAREWAAGCESESCVVVVDMQGGEPPIMELRSVVASFPEKKINFVVIGRGGRREPRLQEVDRVTVDGNVLSRLALLKAVAIAAGRAKESYQESPLMKPRAAITPPPREEAVRQRRLILVVEDDETNQKVIRLQLMLLGQTADVVENGRKALMFWRSGEYSLLITDLQMPEMDGYELAKTVRAEEADKRRMPIIAFTANVLKEDADRCLEVGMDDFLRKPAQMAKLEAMLKKWLPPAPESEPAPQSQSPPVDLSVLKALAGDDDAAVGEFLRDFQASAAKTAAELRTAVKERQPRAAGKLAHKLASSALSVGALTLGELCAEIERSGRSGDELALAALLPGFDREMARVELFIKELT